MTYKAIVDGLIRRDSMEWVEGLLKESGIAYKWVHDCGVNFEPEKEQILYDILLEIVLPDYATVYVRVGGTVSDVGIFHSVIWDREHEIIWMSVEKTRDALGIEEFKIA